MLKLFMSLQFIISLFGLYYLHFMESYAFIPSWANGLMAGFFVGSLGGYLHKFFVDISDIKAALEAKK